eukprot:GGOE01024359.1.p1 GENE.GGOE01024359.1~~GGOE01024359.1.p1  ORF type:complete len:348 (-),score=74.72 GGOE01024359.1:409-1410(-)
MGNAAGNAMFIELFEGTEGSCGYRPGEVLSGVVHLHVVEEIPIDGIFLQIKGMERVSFSPSSLAKASTLRHSLFRTTATLMEGTRFLPPGQHAWPFSCCLPDCCLPSFQAKGSDWQCAVYYKVKGSVALQGILETDLKCSRQFDVVTMPANNNTPVPFHPSPAGKALWSFGTTATCHADLQVSSGAVWAGEVAVVSGDLNNSTSKPLQNTSILLRRKVLFSSGPTPKDVKVTKLGTYPGLKAGTKATKLHLNFTVPAEEAPSCHGDLIRISHELGFCAEVHLRPTAEVVAPLTVHSATGSGLVVVNTPTPPLGWNPVVHDLITLHVVRPSTKG